MFKTTEINGALVQEILAEVGVQLESPEAYAALARKVSGEVPQRFAVVRADSRERVERYLPSNYEVVFAGSSMPDGKTDFVIAGFDEAGWTLDEYVIPRLESGSLFPREYATRDRAFESASAAMN